MINVRRRLVLLLLVLSLLCGYTAHQLWHAHAASDRLQLVRRPAGVQTRDDAELLSGWLDQVNDVWEVGKNHQRVKLALTDVVAGARSATVNVMCAGKQVAMGTVVDRSGYVLTKASEVVAVPGELECRFYDRRRLPARVVGHLEQYDLAMLQVKADDLRPAQWTTADSPTVGSLVATTSLRREPLALGVVSIGPQEVAKDAVLGIRLRDAAEGVLITDVVPQSAANLAGLQAGDIVLRMDRDPVTRSKQVVAEVDTRLPGDGVQLAVRRGKEELTLEAHLGRRTELDVEYNDFQSFLGGDLSFRRSGFPQVIQHDTFLLPEHCGGPLVDLEGRVVGINIARAERIASYALPAAVVLPWIEQLKQGKTDTSDSSVARRN